MSRDRKQLERWHGTLTASIAASRTRPTIASVHELRVAARRLRAYCRLVDAVALDRRLRRLVHLTHALRDLDVVLGTSLPPPMARHLRGERTRARAALRTALGSAKIDDLLREVAHLPSLKAKPSQRRIAQLQRTLGRRARHLRQMADVHALRRVLRTLQYSRQWLGRDATALQVAQRALGEVLDVAMRHTLQQRLSESGLSAPASARAG